MVGKTMGPVYYCSICPKEYKTNNGLKKHCVTEHTVIGARFQDEVVMLQEVDEEISKDDESTLSKEARQEFEAILTTVVDSVTTEMEDIFSQVKNATEIEVEPEREPVVEPVVTKEGQNETISQMCQNMRDMVEVINHPSQINGSCDKCEYVSTDGKDLEEHVQRAHNSTETSSDKDITIKKMGLMLKKASIEKRSLRAQLKDSQKEIAIKTERISMLMVENANKDDMAQNMNPQEKDNEAPHLRSQPIEFDCALCTFKSKNEKELEGHIRFKHLMCQTCNKNFPNVEDFKSHMTTSHTDGIWHKKKKCGLCKRLFSNWTLYEGHIKKHQCIRITCTNCQETFVTKAIAVEHNKNCIKETKFNCHKCEFKATTEEQVSNHLDEVHLKGFETITNMNKSIKEKEKVIDCIYNCDFNAGTEEEVARHIDIVHLEKDVTEPTTTPNTEKNTQSIKECKNGLSCKFLKQNRCMFYHEEAAQSEGQWEVVRPRRQQQGRNIDNEARISGRGSSHRVHSITVKWCRDGDKCRKGYRMSNGKMWSCAFRHQTLGFGESSLNRRQ